MRGWGEERTDLSGVYGWRFGWLQVAERVCLVEGQGQRIRASDCDTKRSAKVEVSVWSWKAKVHRDI